MSLLDTIKADALTARKGRQHKTANALTTLLGELETAAKNTGHPSTDAEVVAAIKKTIKNLDETLKIVAGKNDDRELDLLYERHIFEKYLPQQLGEQELTAAIENIIAAGDGRTVGDVMKALKASFSGQYDGALASKLVKARFA